jgi:hypothetical protein
LFLFGVPSSAACMVEWGVVFLMVVEVAVEKTVATVAVVVMVLVVVVVDDVAVVVVVLILVFVVDVNVVAAVVFAEKVSVAVAVVVVVVETEGVLDIVLDLLLVLVALVSCGNNVHTLSDPVGQRQTSRYVSSITFGQSTEVKSTSM